MMLTAPASRRMPSLNCSSETGCSICEHSNHGIARLLAMTVEPHGVLQQALIYLAAGVIAVPLFKRLGLGSVLGYLAAGVVIGPWGLGLISAPQTLLQFAEFGVV